MKLTAFILLVVVLVGGVVWAAESTKPSATNQQALEAAKALTKITGIAISPLLGVGAVGAYDRWEARNWTEEQKAKLPWYAQWKFFLPALLLVGLVAFKDAAGAALPPGWKKPLDMAEAMENKLTGLVAAGAVVPSVAAVFHSQLTSTASAPVMHAGMLGADLWPLLNILAVPLAITIFVVVWLVGHVINVLILVSPWGAVDAALKSARTAIIASLVALNFIKPELAALLSLVIVVVAYFLAGWSFRLMVMGAVYSWDFLTFRNKRFQPQPGANQMFTSRRIEKTPIRTYGRLSRETSGALVFEYRPWLILPMQRLVLPQGTYVVGRGLFYPEVLQVDGESTRTVLVLPPRYRHHEEEVARIYGIREVRDVGILKGLRAIWSWLMGASAQPA